MRDRYVVYFFEPSERTESPCLSFVSKTIDNLWARADKGDPSLLYISRKLSILRPELIT